MAKVVFPQESRNGENLWKTRYKPRLYWDLPTRKTGLAMAEEDVVAGIWHNLLNKLNADQRFTSQFRGFLSLVVPKGVLGETIYLEVSNDGTRNMIDLRMRSLLAPNCC